MKDDEFEWDDVKAAQNLADHGVRQLAWPSMTRSRWYVSTGKITARVAMSCSAWSKTTSLPLSTRSGAARVRISARLAEPRERRRYHEENR